MKLRLAEPRHDELGYSPRPNPHWPLCVLSHENTRLPLVPQATYVKTEEIAARKGVIFLHLKECACVCWRMHEAREGECVDVCFCMREKHTEGK